MRKMEANAMIRDAKRTSRKMGATLYSEVVDPTTGERTIAERWHHGIPASFTGPSTENAIATLTGVLSVASLYGAAHYNQMSKIGNKQDNKRQRRTAITMGMLSGLGFMSLLPVKIRSPFHGSGRYGMELTNGAGNNPMGAPINN